MQRYKGVFGERSTADETTPHTTPETYEERWGWFITLDALSNHDMTQWPYLLNMGVVEFLNQVSFVKSRIAYEKSLLDNYKNKY